MFTPNDVKLMEGLSTRALSFLVNAVGGDVSADSREMAHSIATLGNPVVPSPAAVIGGEELLQSQVHPEYSHEQLAAMTVPELTQILKDKQIRCKKKKKNDLVEAIKRVQLIPADLGQLMYEQLQDSSRSRGGVHHDFYRDYFNSVDRHDYHWYSLKTVHTVVEWRSKLIFSILQSSMVNAWVLYCHQKRVTLIEFREAIIRAIFDDL